MNTKFFFVSILLFYGFFVSLAMAKDDHSIFCKELKAKSELLNFEAMISFDKSTNFEQRQACKEEFRLHELNIDSFTCDTFIYSMLSDSKNYVKHLNYTSREFSTDTYQRCIIHALVSPAAQLKYNIFKKLLQDLLLLKPSNQQALLDEILKSYVANDKQALKHQYVQLLLALGANPAAKTKDGVPILSEAFWATYVGGGTCKTIQLIIDALSPEDMAISYQKRLPDDLSKSYGATPLMAMADLGLHCPKETLLVAKKAAYINKQDNNGNTALHYYYLRIIKSRKNTLNESDLALIDVLLERGASVSILNNEKITVDQLHQKLKNQKRKECYGERCAELELKLNLQDK